MKRSENLGSARYETRAALVDSAGQIIKGYAALFHSEAVIAGEFRERIAPGAFRSTLRRNDVLALLHHDTHRILGRMSAGTLRLAEDAKGLRFELDADASTPDGLTALGTVRRQDIAGCSFGFNVIRRLDTDERSPSSNLAGDRSFRDHVDRDASVR